MVLRYGKRTATAACRVVATAVLLGVAGPAAAQDAAPGRFNIAPSETGFVRMDTRTGAVSHCSRRDGRWFCEPIPDVGAPAEVRLDAVEDALEELRQRVEALAEAVVGQPRPEAGQAVAPAETAAAETRRGFAVEVMERFRTLVRGLRPRES